MVITHLVLYQGGWFWNIKNSEKDRFQHLELYSEPCQTSKTEHFAWKVNSFFMLTIFGKHSMLDLRSPSWWGFWICNWHHYISNYCAAIFIVNIIFTAGSLILLYLLSTFHIGFIKINSPFPKHFFFLYYAWPWLTYYCLTRYRIWIQQRSNHKNIDGSCIK